MQSLVVLVFGINILAIQSRHRGLSRDGFISIQGYQTDQGHINTEEGQESIEDGTSHVDGLQDALLIFRNGTLVRQQGATNRSSTRKPSLQQISQFPTAQNPNGIPSSTSEPPHTSPQKPTTSPSPQPEPPLPSQSSPSFFNECVCTPFFSCFDNETSSNLTGVVNDIMNVPACQVTQNSCFEPNDICCCNLKPPPSSTSQPQSEPQVPSQSETSPSNDNCNCRPRTECPEDEITEMNNRKLEKGSCEEPNHVCCHELVLPETQSIPSLGTSNLSPAPQPQSPIPPEISHSANASECICTPFYKCYDPEKSSNLNGLVNDRSHNQCLSSEVCCRNRSPPSVQPLASPTIHLTTIWPNSRRPTMITSRPPVTQDPSQTYTQIPSKSPALHLSSNVPAHISFPTEKSPSMSNCNCRLKTKCHDKEFNETLEQQESCQDPNEVCCLEYAEKPTEISHIPPQTSTLRPALMPQSPSPSPIPSPSDVSCICTPFFKCYDQETSSNLTGVVNDRSVNPCPGSNDVCCNNLVAPSEIPEASPSPITTTTNCSGSCIPINECPVLSITLKDAKEGNSDAIQKLRSLVCSNINVILDVCCP